MRKPAILVLYRVSRTAVFASVAGIKEVWGRAPVELWSLAFYLVAILQHGHHLSCLLKMALLSEDKLKYMSRELKFLRKILVLLSK